MPRVSPEEAREAAAGYRGTGLDEFAQCYVCGPEREDAFGVFPARVGDREVVASPWTPPAWTADDEGRARPEHVWAVLDCPTYYASYLDGPQWSFLVRLQVRIDAPVAVGEEHVVVAWPLGVEGRKRHAAAAVLDRDGALLALGRGSWSSPAERDTSLGPMSIVIVGAGPNLGLAIARRFGREGFAVGLVSRTQAKLDDLASQLESEGVTAAGAAADIRDSDALTAAIRSLAERLGEVEVLEYSPLPAPEFMKPILETTVDDVRGPIEFSILGAVAATQAVVGPMRDAGRGTILFTTGGAAINPYPLRAGVGISFAGEVAYARMLHDELADSGVHVAHTAIGGRIAPGMDHEPSDVADVLWSHHADRGAFQTRLGIPD